jgi:hypothetical protein
MLDGWPSPIPPRRRRMGFHLVELFEDIIA